jgi:OOP family OmpA-OmpF porin
MNQTLENFAHAQFGADVVTMGTRVVDGLPSGWSVRMLAAVDALSELSNGAVVVTPDLITVRGNTGSTGASARISRLLIDRLGEQAEFEIDVTYIEALDPIAGLPTPEECVDKILGLTAERKIIFDPGSATLTAESGALVDDIAEVLRRCADLRLEIAGYTDSQGRDSMNLELSQQRANSVLSALRDRRVPVGSFEAIGYGEADPIADNGTEEGREANRRIEFRLITPEPVEEVTTGLEALEEDLASEVESEGAPAAEEAETEGDETPAEADATSE